MDIKSPFNACMHREYCQSEIDRLRAEILYLQKEKASLKEERERANAIIDRLNKREADHIKGA